MLGDWVLIYKAVGKILINFAPIVIMILCLSLREILAENHYTKNADLNYNT